METYSLDVLLIEDNPIDHQVFKGLVKKMDLDTQVHWVKSLAEAKSALEERRYDLIVSDLGLPDCQGFECLARLKQSNSMTPMIILTGTDDDSLLEKASHIGVYDYLVKADLSSGILRRSFRYALSRARIELENERLEEHLKQNQKIEALGQLTGGIAHDFNNKLAIIKGNTQIIRSRLSKNKSIERNLESIDKTVNIAADLTKQLLAFGRKQELSLQSADITKLVGRSLSLLERLTNRNITIKSQGLGTPAFAEIDFTQMDQVLMNLLVNARDAIGSDRGTIQVQVERVQIQKEYSELIPPGSYAVVRVQDDGCGMDEELVQKVLQPFFTTKEKDQGTGLGLSVVDGIVSQLSGYMEINSQINQGTTVSVYFPTSEEKKLTAIDTAIEVALPTESENSFVVLYAEDDDNLRELTQASLQEEGFTVLTARNGVEGLKLFTEYQDVVDVVLSDARMPEMGGKEMMQEIRKISPEIGVVFLTGYSETALSSSGDFPDKTRFHTKPCTLAELTLSINLLAQYKEVGVTGDKPKPKAS